MHPARAPASSRIARFDCPVLRGRISGWYAGPEGSGHRELSHRAAPPWHGLRRDVVTGLFDPGADIRVGDALAGLHLHELRVEVDLDRLHARDAAQCLRDGIHAVRTTYVRYAIHALHHAPISLRQLPLPVTGYSIPPRGIPRHSIQRPSSDANPQGRVCPAYVRAQWPGLRKGSPTR